MILELTEGMVLFSVARIRPTLRFNFEAQPTDKRGQSISPVSVVADLDGFVFSTGILDVHTLLS